jgi:uncharacterized membrane protein
VNALMVVHIAGGTAALAAGAVAGGARKGGRIHARAGDLFAAAMMTMAVTAMILVATRGGTERNLPAGSLLVCYFVATGWWTARNRSGTAGRFEVAALIVAAGIAAGSFAYAALAPHGGDIGTVLFTGLLATLAGAYDLVFIQKGRLSGAERLRRHLWRMCVAFFFASGAFFLGQQDVMPAAVRGSVWLFLPALAPLALMIFWLAKLGAARGARRGTDSGSHPVETLAHAPRGA